MALDLHREEPWTYGDYLTLPEDGNRYEVIDGKLYVTPAPSLFHQRIVGRLFRWLGQLEDAGLGTAFCSPVELVMEGCSPVQPDILFLAPEDRARMQPGRVTGATLVVEALSPSTQSRDTTVKLRNYTRNRIPHYWIADPEECTMQILELEEGGYRLRAALKRGDRFRWAAYPQLELDLSWVFEPLPD